MKLKLPNKIKIVIIGFGYTAKDALIFSKKYFSDILFITNDCWGKKINIDIDFFSLTKELNITFFNIKKQNDLMPIIKNSQVNICLVVGSLWIFKNDFINYFKGLIFNYHTSKIPFYQGSSSFSWQIMNNEKYLHLTIHQLTKKIDNGGILLSKKKYIGRYPTPNLLIKNSIILAKLLIQNFFSLLSDKKGNNIRLQKIDKQEFYLPFIDAEIHGAINFNWSIIYIERFIRAFSFPYTNAYTYCNEYKIYIVSSKIISNRLFHPFCYGQILSKKKKCLNIACKNGILEVKIKKNNIFNTVKVGDRFFTPQSILEKSINYRLKSKNLKYI